MANDPPRPPRRTAYVTVIVWIALVFALAEVGLALATTREIEPYYGGQSRRSADAVN